MKDYKQIQIDYINRHYTERRGVLIKKYRSIFGKYVFVIEENGDESKVYVGKSVYMNIEPGAKLTFGTVKRKLNNIQ